MDDILVMGSDLSLIASLLAKLSVTFKIKYLGAPNFFLGTETVKHDGSLLLSQKQYMSDILKRAGMVDYKPLATHVPVTHP